jgi:hypothetical protein
LSIWLGRKQRVMAEARLQMPLAYAGASAAKN